MVFLIGQGEKPLPLEAMWLLQAARPGAGVFPFQGANGF
jgi:hypothetical protein